MKLIVGLGNPGSKYEKTRHNAGFIILDKFAEINNSKFTISSKMGALVTQVKDLHLCKPQSFMNKSGESVSKMSTFFKIDPSQILVINDDLDLEFGVIKLQKGRSSAGHKGVQDIIEKLGTKEFWRLRVGIGRPTDATSIEDYVLKDFTPSQIKWLREIDLHEYILVEE